MILLVISVGKKLAELVGKTLVYGLKYAISPGSKIFLQSKTILEVKVCSLKTSGVWLDVR